MTLETGAALVAGGGAVSGLGEEDSGGAAAVCGRAVGCWTVELPPLCVVAAAALPEGGRVLVSAAGEGAAD